MNGDSVRKEFLYFITPDPNFPEAGIVRITNNNIKFIAKMEGFIDETITNNEKIITDEERLVVKIMFNHDGSVLLKKERHDDRQLIIYFHDDGIVSCENEDSDMVLFHCFASVEDLLAYHINDYISVDYNEPQYPFHFLVPTDGTLYREPHTIFFSEKIKTVVTNKLKTTDANDTRRFRIEKSYIDEWDKPYFSLQLFANNQAGEIGFISFLFCDTCIWAIYPYEKDYARVKVIGSAEAQNKFCEFIMAFSGDGD